MKIKHQGTIGAWLGLFICFFVPVPSVAKAEAEPGYNISVKIDPTAILSLNEKIEVHCEKNGCYIMTVDLNKNNRYEYRKVFENGTYTFQARVRYDMEDEYTVVPDSQTIELDYKNNRVLNEVTFKIEGISPEEENHSHLHENTGGEGEMPRPGEKTYTVDDMEELLMMQESALSEAEGAYADREAWERSHDFLAQHGIQGQRTAPEDGGPMHVYPGVGTTEFGSETKSEGGPDAKAQPRAIGADKEDSASHKALGGLMAITVLPFVLALVWIWKKVRK